MKSAEEFIQQMKYPANTQVCLWEGQPGFLFTTGDTYMYANEIPGHLSYMLVT